MARKRITVKGKVQGVFFRASTQQTARRLGIKGWVRNLLNGDVEILAVGDNAGLEAFISWCRKGPEMAHVEKIIVLESKDEEHRETPGFEILG